MRGLRVRAGALFLGFAAVLSFALPAPADPPPKSDAKKKDEPKRVVDEPYPQKLRDRVRDALDRGAVWLKTQQEDDGSFGDFGKEYPVGPTALATLTLLKCGVKSDDPAVGRAFAWMRGKQVAKTYEAGVLLMALAAAYDPGADPFAGDEIDPAGRHVVHRVDRSKVSKEDAAWATKTVQFLVDAQIRKDPFVDRAGGTIPGLEDLSSIGSWSYPDRAGGMTGLSGDTSNTQYALLGLEAGARLGARAPTEVWVAALERLMSWQARKGPPISFRANEVRGADRLEWTEPSMARGFGYVGPTEKDASGGLTTAGVAGLMICLSELQAPDELTSDRRETTRAAIRDAFAWLESKFTVSTNPGDTGTRSRTWYLSYLYGLERAGTLGHVRFVGSHDWYLEGANRILGMLKSGGGLDTYDVIDTCLALLFLRRGSFRTANPVITPANPPSGPPGGAPEQPTGK